MGALYLRGVFDKSKTPQSEPLDERQVKNSAGGYSFSVTDWVRLERFLILGSEGGSYYASERKLTLENAQAVERCIKEDGARVVETVRRISLAGRAPKNDPALFALAMVMAQGTPSAKAAARGALLDVARTGTHLFNFVSYVTAMRGWGRSLRRAVGDWYLDMPLPKLAYQAIKYQQRGGWSHADLLRLTHPKVESGHEDRGTVLGWMVDGWPSVGDEPHPVPVLRKIWAHERLKKAATVKEVVKLILDYDLPRESVPTQWLNEKEVWAALLSNMPLTAMIRNLGKMTSIGLIAPNSNASRNVVRNLTDQERIKYARVHPLSVLIAQKVYEQGHGEKGSLSWTPVRPVVDALDDAFYLAFGNVPATGKRFYLGIDVSGSMSFSDIAGMPGITPRVGAAAMAMVTARSEEQYYAAGFTHQMEPLGISPKHSLADAIRITSGLPFGRTDCALPMLDAAQKKIPVDTFVIYTDSETWFGNIHPTEALKLYRDSMGIPAKLVVCGMLSNGFTVADPADAGQLDVVGFDTATPSLIGQFAAGFDQGDTTAGITGTGTED